GAASPTNGGTEGSTGPCSLATSAPMLGRPPTVARDFFGQPDVHCKASCPPVDPTTERMATNLSIRAAIFGKTSPICRPGTRVAIGLNSPRISAGAEVLISHMSWCGGPPPRKTLITDLWPELLPANASAR